MTCTWNENVLFVSVLNIYLCLFDQTILWIWIVSILIPTILRMTTGKKTYGSVCLQRLNKKHLEAWQISALRVHSKMNSIILQVILRTATRYQIHLWLFFTEKMKKIFKKSLLPLIWFSRLLMVSGLSISQISIFKLTLARTQKSDRNTMFRNMNVCCNVRCNKVNTNKYYIIVEKRSQIYSRKLIRWLWFMVYDFCF